MRLAVTWEMCGYVDVKADTLEEAMENFNKESDYINCQMAIMQMEVFDYLLMTQKKWKLLQISNETKIYLEGVKRNG